ncbi:MAG: PA2169 family four-helix-bundle protein [Pseudomonadota bacterium]
MNTIELLKDLTQTTYDSVEGYRKAAEQVDKAAFKRAFERRRDTRRQTLERLNSALQAQGEEPITSASISSQAHQYFLTLSDAVINDDKAVISRIEEGEGYIADEFRDALKKNEDMETSVRLVIEQAYREISEGERFAEMLEENYA